MVAVRIVDHDMHDEACFKKETGGYYLGGLVLGCCSCEFGSICNYVQILFQTLIVMDFGVNQSIKRVFVSSLMLMGAIWWVFWRGRKLISLVKFVHCPYL